MKNIKKNLILIKLFIMICFFVSCTKKTKSIEEQINTHKQEIYLLGDSLNNMETRIDSLVKIYSKK
jgi:hypothetical protein